MLTVKIAHAIELCCIYQEIDQKIFKTLFL